MLQKALTESGQKARQRTDKEDRSLPYRDWLRNVPANGIFFDIDLIKCKKINDQFIPSAITELTRTDSETVPKQAYLDAIINRWFHRDSQAGLIESVAIRLGIPAYLVLFPPNVSWLYVFSFKYKRWRLFSPQAWVDFLAKL